jgi:hypothetical protein
VKKSFNIQELLHCKSKRHGTKAHAPFLVESFPKKPKTQSEASWLVGSHNYKTKQNKLPSFIHRVEHPTASQFRQKAKLKMKISKTK